MADGDIYHNNIPQRYQKLYHQVEQGYDDPEVLAHEALEPLKKDIQKFGEPVIQFLEEAARQIKEHVCSPLFVSSDDRDALKQSIEELSQKVYSDKKAVKLACNACEQYINQFPSTDYGSFQDYNPFQDVVRAYIMNVYISRFEARAEIPPTGKCAREVQVDIPQVLVRMRPYVEEKVDYLSKQVSKSGRVDTIRLPLHPYKEQPVNLNENLLAPKKESTYEPD